MEQENSFLIIDEFCYYSKSKQYNCMLHYQSMTVECGVDGP